MRFGRAKLPPELAGRGGKVVAWARVGDGRVWALYRNSWAVAGELTLEFDYCDVKAASWRNENRTMTVSFVAPEREPLAFALAEGEGDDAVAVFRELVDASFFWRARRVLPSGAEAECLVRRNGRGELFTQILASGPADGHDRAELARIEAEMRDLAGLS